MSNTHSMKTRSKAKKYNKITTLKIIRYVMKMEI